MRGVICHGMTIWFRSMMCIAFPFRSPQSRSQSLSSLWPVVVERELWEQPFWNNKGNHRILPIRFHAVCFSGAFLKWLLLELSIPAKGQKDRGLLGRECPVTQKLQCKRNLPNLVLMPLFLRPVIKHHPCKQLKLCGPYYFFDRSTIPDFSAVCNRSYA